MRFLRLKVLLLSGIFLVAIPIVTVFWWAERPLQWDKGPIEFTLAPGHSLRQITQDIADAGVPVEPWLLGPLARLEGRAAHLQAGTYAVTSGITPAELLTKIERGEVLQIELVVPEGWTFRQLQAAITQDVDLKQTVRGWSDAQLLQALGADEASPEGLFAPDTYRFAHGTTDLELYRRAYRVQQKRLSDAWASRKPDLPLSSSHEALVLASIVEKETGRAEDRPLVAAVFLNRLRRGMLLQTDPTVIYGLGATFDGTLRKRDLMADTPYNTYLRAGLPPTPISLPGSAALSAVVNPSASDALYFVARGDGTSQFSGSIDEHNKAVSKYQKGGHP
jgi:UPF0755 protein